MPISPELFEAVKARYGYFASWAAWSPPGDKPKSNMEDLSIFHTPQLASTLKELGNEYALVALNISTKEIAYPLSNFHGQNGEVYKARHALAGTPLWGSYMTDFFKNFPEPDSSKVEGIIRKNPRIIEPHVQLFREEIAILGNQNIKIVAFGSLVYSLLKECLSDEFSVYKIDHYAVRLEKNRYREKVWSQIEDFHNRPSR